MRFLSAKLDKRLIAAVSIINVASLVIAQTPNLNISIKNILVGYSSDQRFSNPQGIFYDKKFKETYVCDSGNHQVVIFDSTGYPLYRFKHWVEREGKRNLGEPKSLAVSSQGDIFLVDNLAEYIDVLDHRGEPEDRINLAGILHLPEVKPTQLALDDQENLYIGYRGEKAEMVVLNPDWQVALQLKNQTENQQNFGEITGIWVDSEGRIYITDALNEPCVKIFTSKGEFIFGFGKHDVGWDGFSLPSGVVTTRDGTIWIVDTFRQVVKGFTPKGEFIMYIGGYGRMLGEMKYPGAIAGDGFQSLFVLEKVGERAQEFVVQAQ